MSGAERGNGIMNRRSLLALTGLFGLTVTLNACDTKKVFGCMPVDDPWKHPPGQRDGINDTDIKTNTVFVPVSGDKFDATMTWLKRKPFAPLTDKDLADLGVTAPASAAGLSPYVMRALSSRQPNSQYVVVYMDDHVWVRYVPGNNDSCAPVFHEAIVAWLPKPPFTTYATVSFTE